MNKTMIALILALISSATSAFADGLPKDDPLYVTAKSLDAELFNAYNQCELAELEGLVSEDLEFYHDLGGLMQGRKPFIDAINANICHKVERQLIEDSLEIYPLNGYGFIEKGVHTFCNKTETPICQDPTNGEGKFFMLWQKTETGYKLTRVISFDHMNSWQRNQKLETLSPEQTH